MKGTSIFYGDGPAREESGVKTGSAPLCGDPLDDLRAQLMAKAEEAGFSKEEISQRLKEEPHVAEVVLSESSIKVGGHELEHLNPSVRAFYILVARHPEGIVKEEDPESILKGSFRDRYLAEYKDILSKLERSRKAKKSNGIKFDLDSRFPHYRNDVNNAITAIEKANGDLDLSSCKVFGEKCLKITAKVVDLTAIFEVPEL